MYKKFGLTLLFMAVFLFSVIGVFAQEGEVEIAEEVIEPVTPPRLFVAPTANVIRSLDVSLVDTSKGKVTYSTRTSDFYVVASKTIKLPSEEVRSISMR